MSREVYLLVFQQRNVPAHWSMFVPKTGSAVEGKIIHVIGSPFTGYGLEFKRNYDLSRTSRKYTKMVLGQVDNSHIKDVEATENTADIEAYDDLENEAKLVQAPGVSPSPLDHNVGKNCQHWLQEFVEKLVEKGIMAPSAITVLDEAPRT